MFEEPKNNKNWPVFFVKKSYTDVSGESIVLNKIKIV